MNVELVSRCHIMQYMLFMLNGIFKVIFMFDTHRMLFSIINDIKVDFLSKLFHKIEWVMFVLKRSFRLFWHLLKVCRLILENLDSWKPHEILLVEIGSKPHLEVDFYTCLSLDAQNRISKCLLNHSCSQELWIVPILKQTINKKTEELVRASVNQGAFIRQRSFMAQIY